MKRSPPARLWVLLARRAPVGVIIRRGSSLSRAGRIGETGQLVGRGVPAADAPLDRRSSSQEEEVQEINGVRDLRRAVVVEVAGLPAGRPGSSEEEVLEEEDGVAQVDAAVRVGVAAP